MKKKTIIFLSVGLLLALVVASCAIDMYQMSNNKPVIFSTWGRKYTPPLEEQSLTGIVKKVYENSFLMLGKPTEGYPNAEEYCVSLKVENEDSYTSVAVGDEVIVYHNGEIAESDPLQINTVYSITLKTAAMNNESVPKELPGLTISYGEEEITAWVGTHHWIYRDNAIIADSNHPLHCMETMSFIPVHATTASHAVGYEPGQVTLNFDIEPTDITVYRYDVEAADETAGDEIIMDNDYTLDLAYGNYLYHIVAEWNYPDKELDGSGDFAFYTKVPEIYKDITDKAENSDTTNADYDLSNNDAMQVTDTVEKDNVFIVSQSLRTNSTEITVENKSGIDVDVFLYSEDDLTNPILQMTVNNGKSKSFTGLTSRFVYYIGFCADTSTQLDISITD